MAESGKELSAGSRHPSVGSPFCRISVVINWRRPLWTSSIFVVTNSVFWFVTLSPCKLFSLMCLSLALMVVLQFIRDLYLMRSKGTPLWHSMTGSWEMIHSRHGGELEPASQITDSWTSFKLFLEETSSFKQQNPGKFCLLVCSLCSFLAVLGRYIPGIVLSYILVLGIFLWPLVSSHDFGLWFEPVLQKLDFGLGQFLQKIKENHEKRVLQAQEEHESIEADLSSLFPKLDSTVYKELSLSDTEPSEVTWTENGTFNLSEGHSPQTENSEDLDRPSDHEELFAGGLPDFPSLDNGLGTNGDDDEDLSIGLPSPAPQTKPKHKQRSEQGRASLAAEQRPDPTLQLVERMAGDVIAAAVTAAIQERLEATVASAMSPASADAACPSFSSSSSASTPPAALAQALAEDSDSEAEDFELLDQAELEQLEGELGLERAGGRAAQAQPRGGSRPAGFFSKLLGRH
ncbi:reticulophagy regulator 1 isoform X1 [Alosa alosa]|uniref:reticulophagy regulator 1 isoform X1 n=1 Tax=Alosa alosa TaxID=278164 RepID=UPI002015154B|nr:reticulophagy regulator 1 isoform X1 [Alosa alosa]